MIPAGANCSPEDSPAIRLGQGTRPTPRWGERGGRERERERERERQRGRERERERERERCIVEMDTLGGYEYLCGVFVAYV